MPGILFLCVHNSGRSQMAAGFARQHQGVRVYSGGSEPADSVNPVAVGAMAEVGIDIAGHVPMRFTDEVLREVDVVVTMGCGDACPFVPGKRYIDWPLDDPKGRGIEDVRRIRDEIRALVDGLVAELRAARQPE